ncbi:MAG TPA: insulinase family protein [Chitinophagales bacterium]|nr:insulinase family protein [Chitinophagales bacterium]
MRLTHIYKILLPGLVLISQLLNAQSEVSSYGGLVDAKLPSGINAIITQLPSASKTEINLYVNAGSMYEADSLNGMARMVETMIGNKINAALRSNRYAVNAQNTEFKAYTTPDHAVFKFTTYPYNISNCLEIIRDSVFGAQFSNAEVSQAMTAALKDIEGLKYDKKRLFDNTMIKNLYTQDHSKLEIYGNTSDIKNFSRKLATGFFTRYYAPNNAVVAITGNIDPVNVQSQVETALKNLKRNEFNPETIIKSEHLRPIAYTTQFVIEDTISEPEFSICWQFPGSGSDRRATYCGFLLNALLNDPYNYIRVKATKMGCKKFDVNYDANVYNGVLKVTFQPGRKDLAGTYDFVMKELLRIDKTLLNEEMLNAAKLRFKKEYDNLKASTSYADWVAKYWVNGDESYFVELKDSVTNIDADRMHNFIVAYMNQAAHVTGLRIKHADRVSLNTDSSFADLDEGVGKYVFTYRENVTDIEGAQNQAMLNNLLQWLKINPDISAQVNGFSDEHEFDRITNDTLTNFMDSVPTFRLTTTKVNKKGTLRPETVRALKIIKYLYDNGISANRLSGTSMPFKSDDKQGATANMKCTLTLNKYHKSPSLYEYHYGVKKE